MDDQLLHLPPELPGITLNSSVIGTKYQERLDRLMKVQKMEKKPTQFTREKLKSCWFRLKSYQDQNL